MYLSMKRIIMILGLIIVSVTAAKAQYVYPSELNARGSKIIADGQKLTTQQAYELFTELGGEQYGESYLTNRKGLRTGVTLSLVGPVAAVAGSYATIIGALMTIDPDHAPGSYIICYTGMTVAISGALMTLAGIPIACVCSSRIKKSIITPASSGIGIAMNF